MGEHVRLVTGGHRIEQERFAIGNDSRRLRISPEPTAPVSLARDALVTAAENRHSPTAGMQSARKLFNDRRLTRPADGQIANADHQTAERAFAENSFAIEVKPQLHDPVVNE